MIDVSTTVSFKLLCLAVLVIGLGVRGTFVQIFSLSVGLHILFWNLALEASARRVCHRPEVSMDISIIYSV